MNLKHLIKYTGMIIASMAMLLSCEEDSIPDTGELPDRTPPAAAFSSTNASESDFTLFVLVNESVSATDYLWEVPDGIIVENDPPADDKTALEAQDLQIRIPDFGTYEFTLTASDKNNVESTVTKEIEFLRPNADPAEPNFSNTVIGMDFQLVTFTNTSTNTPRIEWIFPAGTTIEQGTVTDNQVAVRFPADGIYEVTLRGFNGLGESVDLTRMIEVSSRVVPSPVLLNSNFDRLARMGSTNTCACAGWVNRDIGDIGESSTGNGSDVIKFDNVEPDIAYQEFAVTPNANYSIEIPIRFQGDQPGDLISQLELRVLAGSGYEAGYTPVYFTDTAAAPQRGYGYTSITQVEAPANNLLTQVVANQNTSAYITFTFTFNSGDNDSVALFLRGIGGLSTPTTGAGDFGFNSGNEEIRADSVTITAVNN